MSNHVLSNSEEFSIRNILPILFALVVTMLLVMLDSTVMNIALPSLEKTLHTDLKTIQWAITGYTLALSAVIPLAGWFSDRFKAKWVLTVCIIAFTISSILCSIAATAAQLITFRVIQGLSGGMIAPICMAVSFTVAPPDKRGSIMGILGLPMLVSPILGPILSGYFLQYFNWHWIFRINLPIGIIALCLVLKFIPISKSNRIFKLDVLGAILAPLSFTTLVYSVHNTSTYGWTNSHTILPLVIGIFLLILFIFIELNQQEPLIELRCFSSLEFSKGMILTCLNWMTLFGSTLLVPVFLQQVRGLSTLEAGLQIIPQAVMSFIGMLIGGKLFDKYGVKPVVFTGMALFSIALFCLSNIQPNTNAYLMTGVITLMGLGQGLTTMQLGTHVLKSAPAKLISRVTTLTNSSQQVFSSFAVAILSGVLSSNISHHLHLLHHSGSREVIKATTSGFHDTFSFAMILMLCGVILSLFLQTKKAEQTVKPSQTLKESKNIKQDKS
ncbi:MDR family MFS transporter [Heyndrickxia ginsengihumi]|uniref:MDR family MFS transporter n=1 Tax=Heyndrickxia ginsengihumi TaxID=363870 RepID=UPI0020403E41|nr:MDR family MFS transporter [Heyndrickxia ginsengihumi]MCM3022722.1 multidrug efflux MFS transporter [Heyndrickxia ginsengihumi]